MHARHTVKINCDKLQTEQIVDGIELLAAKFNLLSKIADECSPVNNEFSSRLEKRDSFTTLAARVMFNLTNPSNYYSNTCNVIEEIFSGKIPNNWHSLTLQAQNSIIIGAVYDWAHKVCKGQSESNISDSLRIVTTLNSKIRTLLNTFLPKFFEPALAGDRSEREILAYKHFYERLRENELTTRSKVLDKMLNAAPQAHLPNKLICGDQPCDQAHSTGRTNGKSRQADL